MKNSGKVQPIDMERYRDHHLSVSSVLSRNVNPGHVTQLSDIHSNSKGHFYKVTTKENCKASGCIIAFLCEERNLCLYTEIQGKHVLF